MHHLIKKAFKYTGRVVLLTLLLAAGAYIYFTFFFVEAAVVDPASSIEGVAIQPSEALELADPHLEEHGTFEWSGNQEMQTHMVQFKGSYFVKRTNYPAIYVGYYKAAPAIEIDMETGEVSFVTKEE